MSDARHKRSIVVWDAPSAVACGESFAVKIGIKCDSGCAPTGWHLAVRDHQGETRATAVTKDEAWPATEALHGAEVSLVAPAEAGLFNWDVVAAAEDKADAGAGDPASAHDEVRAGFNVRTVDRVDHCLTVTAVERVTGEPVPGARVVVHPFRAVTDARGIAVLNLPAGDFRLFVSGTGFLPLRLDGELAGDETICAELDPDLEPSDAELWS